MSPDALIAINEELRRLQQEGLDHVFVDDATLALLKPVAPVKQASPQSPPSQAAGSGPIPELEALLDKKESVAKKSAAPAAKSTSAHEPLSEAPAAFELPAGDAASRLAWLQERVESCPVCQERRGENGKLVFGSGPPEAAIFFCSEAPDAEEERQSEPFLGSDGKLLTKIIQAMGLKREEVYLANIVKWRPHNERTKRTRPPTAEEMRFCLPYLKAQIEIVQPKVIVSLGHPAATALLGPDPDRRMASIRGTWQEFAGIPLMITFHPSYLLRAESEANPNAKKRQAWEDMLKVMEKAELPISEKQRGFFTYKR
ncbi:MAG: uracil-DNA glycosylase [Opitutales bacterium]